MQRAPEILGRSLSADDAQALFQVLNTLAEEMRPMRQTDVSDVEPAVLYEARP